MRLSRLRSFNDFRLFNAFLRDDVFLTIFLLEAVFFFVMLFKNPFAISSSSPIIFFFNFERLCCVYVCCCCRH